MSKLVLMAVLLGALACGDSLSSSPDAARDGGIADGGPDCFPYPTHHQELINACTTSQHVEKNAVLPLLNADGTLPPLP